MLSTWVKVFVILDLLNYPHFVTCVYVVVGSLAQSVAAGDHHTCAVLLDGSVACWGLNNHGQLGTGDTTNIVSPSAINLGIGAAPFDSEKKKKVKDSHSSWKSDIRAIPYIRQVVSWCCTRSV